MVSPVIGVAVLSVLYVVWKYLYHTDTPKIKGLPEIPGLPLFGSLIELGQNHAKVAQGWSQKYGWPVFQARLGNKVRIAAWHPRRRGSRTSTKFASNSESSSPTPSIPSAISG
jgi:hypothetical protein